MPSVHQSIKLSKKEESYLREILSKGVHSARKLRRAQILLMNFEGMDPKEIAKSRICSVPTVYNILNRYRKEGVESAINERPRYCHHKRKVNSKIEAEVTMIACSDPPPGYSRWTVRLITDKYIEISNEEEISRESVRRILKKVN